MTELLRRRQILVGGGALALAGAAFAAEPRRTEVDFTRKPLDALIPFSVGLWNGSEDPDVVPETVDASIDHGQTITRRYLGEGLAPVMLVISYHGPQSPDLKVHRPETCYTVAGFTHARPKSISVPLSAQLTVPSVQFTARRESRTETVLYWTRVGDRFPQTLTGQRIDFLSEALRGLRADGLLMRASTLGEDAKGSLETLGKFAQTLVQSASPAGRKLLLGPAGALAAHPRHEMCSRKKWTGETTDEAAEQDSRRCAGRLRSRDHRLP